MTTAVNNKTSIFSETDLMLIMMSVVWGLNFTAIKGALADFQPLTFNALRFGTSSIFLLAVLWMRERSIGIYRKDLAKFVLLAIVGNTAYQLFFINGIALTTATNSALILATTPIFIILFGALLHVEKVTGSVVQSVILSFVGVLMIVFGTGGSLTFSGQSLLGDLLIVANPICWSIYTVLSKPMFKEYSPLRLTAVTMAIGAVPLVVIGAPTFFTQNWAAISLNSWLGLGFSAFFAIGVGYVLWYTGVSRIGSARTSLYDNLVTVFAVASAWILLSEVMSWLQILGAVLVFVSLYVVRRRKNAEKLPDNSFNPELL